MEKKTVEEMQQEKGNSSRKYDETKQ